MGAEIESLKKRQDKVAMDLGFYYMANAMGRLVGTLLGGFLYYYTVSKTYIAERMPT